MDCQYRKLLFRDTDGRPVYVCCREGAESYGKEPRCDGCGEIGVIRMDSGAGTVEA